MRHETGDPCINLALNVLLASKIGLNPSGGKSKNRYYTQMWREFCADFGREVSSKNINPLTIAVWVGSYWERWMNK